MARTPKERPQSGSRAPHPVWLCVFELAGGAVPRRFPEKPHVRVEQKPIKPGSDLNAWLERARSGKHPDFVRVLDSEMPAEHEPGGLHNPFEFPRDQARIKKALTNLRDRLRCDGFTLGGSATVWSVYVIELQDDHILKKPDGYRGFVYVGETSLPVEERVRQHQLGKAYPWKDKPKHSPDCHKYFRRYAPELVPERCRVAIPCRRKSLRFERDLRVYLERRGYLVIGGTDLLPDKKPKRRGADG